MKILVANEKFVEKGGASSDSDDDVDSDDEDEDFVDEDDENLQEQATYNKLKKGKIDLKQKGGKIDDESDSDDDSDYEENAGEFALFDSPLEKTDELLFLKETLETIHNVD